MSLTFVRHKSQPAEEGKKSGSGKGPAGKGSDSPDQQPFDFADYFKGVRQEWHKITWPTREQIIAETGVVLLVVAIFSAFVFLMDKIFQLLIQAIT